jgi:hypothetical protein
LLLTLFLAFIKLLIYYRRFKGAIPTHQFARALDVTLSKFGFKEDNTLLATSLCCDEVCRDLEDELKSKYGQNFSFGGIAGFPFGGCTAFGALCHHIPKDGNCVIVFGSHVGIDFDGIIGKVNRKGHHGSGECCNSAIASLAYVRAVSEGNTIDSPDASDPIDAQQVFVDAALMKHSDRLVNAPNPHIELPHVVLDCQEELIKRIIDKCLKDIPDGVQIAVIGGIQINTPEGTSDYFLPKEFSFICNNKKSDDELLLKELLHEGSKDPMAILQQQRLKKLMEKAKDGLVDVPMIP